jgi:serine/threonine protein kinase/uncharacterized protein YutE (UPF0331/DUF86 family)
MATTLHDLESVDDPLELFRLASEAILQRQTDIDRLAEIRTRAVAALHAQGLSNRDIARLVGVSPPRVSQLVSANDAATIAVFRAWSAIEQTMADLLGISDLQRSVNTYHRARQILINSEHFDKTAIADLDELRATRNAIVHGKWDISEREAERLVDKAAYLKALITLVASQVSASENHAGQAEAFREDSPSPSALYQERRLRTGLRFGPWVTTRRLGRGSNGEVWEARGTDERTYAIKIFTPGGPRDRLRRFRKEIKFLSDHRMHPGILPLLDSFIGTTSGDPVWYVMPKAIPIGDALGNDPNSIEVVAAIATIASTLADLAEQGIFHRDIKPANLFRLGDSWVIGDFGLAKYPDMDPVSEHGKRLGPIDYMAPEMRSDADRTPAGPADVWALSKTLWVLLTGNSLPLPGPHRPADPAYMLHTRITFNRARELDLLMERATETQPEDRLTMREMASELQACIEPVPEAAQSAGLAELSSRVAALIDPDRRKALAARERRHALQMTAIELAQLTQKVSEELQQVLGFDASTDSGYSASLKLRSVEFTAYSWNSSGVSLRPPGPRPKVTVVIATTMRILHEGDPASLAAVLNVVRSEDGLEHVSEIWSATYDGVVLSSARQAHVLAAIRAGFVDSFEDAARRVADLLAEDSVEN